MGYIMRVLAYSVIDIYQVTSEYYGMDLIGRLSNRYKARVQIDAYEEEHLLCVF